MCKQTLTWARSDEQLTTHPGPEEPEGKPMDYNWVIIILDGGQVLWRREPRRGFVLPNPLRSGFLLMPLCLCTHIQLSQSFVWATEAYKHENKPPQRMLLLWQGPNWLLSGCCFFRQSDQSDIVVSFQVKAKVYIHVLKTKQKHKK